MMRFLIGLAAVLVVPLVAWSQSSPISLPQAPTPDWVEYIAPPTDPFIVDPVDGARFLVSDRQRNFQIDEPTLYVRNLVEVTTPAGLETAAAWQIEFDPLYESVELHAALIHRGGSIIDRSAEIRVDILRREENLERQMYDGRYTASIQVPGVGVGDVVEIAYSRIGWRDAFRGRYFNRSTAAFGVPVGQLFTRTIWPAGRAVQFRADGLDAADVIRLDTENGTEFRYGPATTTSHVNDAGTPNWRRSRPGFELSEFERWDAFAEWADLWFEPEIRPDDPDLVAYAEQVRSLARSESPLALAEAALTAVQNDVRYLAVSLGDGGFEPRPVSQTLESRFGDCKDKTVVLASILRYFGFEAEPALVGIGRGRGIADDLPGVGAFDHVIVRFTHDGRTYWLDPTRSYQRGQLSDLSLYQPDYGLALPLVPGATLGEMAADDAEYPVTRLIEETIDASEGALDPGTLTVHAVYRLDEADSVRRYYAAQGRSGLRNYFTEIYDRRFPGLEIAADGFSVTDDAMTNTLTIDIVYDVPTMFQTNRNLMYLEMLTYGIPPVFSEDVSGRRDDPAVLPFPIHAVHRTRLDLRGSNHRWNLRTGHRRLTNDGFVYVFDRMEEDGYFVFEHQLRIKAPEVSADAVQEVFDESLEVNANRNLSVWRRR
jgi:transglutaminase-like putative cysteine protease